MVAMSSVVFVDDVELCSFATSNSSRAVEELLIVSSLVSVSEE